MDTGGSDAASAPSAVAAVAAPVAAHHKAPGGADAAMGAASEGDSGRFPVERLASRAVAPLGVAP
eukprot:6496173-Lingulodinium_polyedra.AAC.1